MLGPASEQFRLKPDLITNETVIKDLVAYFTWSFMIAMQGYTNGFPYMPGLIEPTANVTYASWITLFTIMLVVMPMAGYVVLKLMDYWNEPRLSIQLPLPNDAQRLALTAFLLAGIALGIQGGLLGAYTMHLYVDTSLYGINLIPILPFNVSRALHYTLAVLWIAVTWIAFSFFVFPYFGLSVSRRQVLTVLVIGGIGLNRHVARYMGELPPVNTSALVVHNRGGSGGERCYDPGHFMANTNNGDIGLRIIPME